MSTRLDYWWQKLETLEGVDADVIKYILNDWEEDRSRLRIAQIFLDQLIVPMEVYAEINAVLFKHNINIDRK